MFLLSLALHTALIGMCAPSKHMLKCKHHQDIRTFRAGAAGLNWAFEPANSEAEISSGWKCHLRFPKQFAFPQAGSTSDSSEGPWLLDSVVLVLPGWLPLACSAGCMGLSPLGMQTAGTDAGAQQMKLWGPPKKRPAEPMGFLKSQLSQAHSKNLKTKVESGGKP